ncbi:MAG: pyridoxamine 5'-phosphate oxidase family protein [Actinobacteria bacterium]|nr:pyridoxamine 5'-phosphate oxidase family protein [Actinomycetota bacterium]
MVRAKEPGWICIVKTGAGTTSLPLTAWCSSPSTTVVVEGRIYVRTETPLIDGAEVAFEVDQVDEAEHQGWSVVVTGPVHAVGPDDVPAEARERLVTWAPGDRRAWSAIDVETITGCWVRAGRLRRGTDGRGYL